MKIAARFSCVAVLTALVLGTPAALAARLTHADRVAINATLDTFVNHAVKRQDPAAAYFVVTPGLRDGMSLKAWSTGSIPAYPYPARGTKFHDWTFSYRDGKELGLGLMLMPRRGSKLGPYQFSVILVRHGRRWLVDQFQPAATFAPTNAKRAKVTAVTDFGPAGTPAEGDIGPTHVSKKWAFAPFALLGVFVVVLAGFGVVATVRNRRAIGAGGPMPPPIPEHLRRRR
ncbi:MAG: hypothetical protein ACXVFC_00780 [Gaiellaceae bacterium]